MVRVVPKQNGIAAVGDDVIHGISRRDSAVPGALSFAQRMVSSTLGAIHLADKPGSILLPLRTISTVMGGSPKVFVGRSSVSIAATGGDQDGTTGLGTGSPGSSGTHSPTP